MVYWPNKVFTCAGANSPMRAAPNAHRLALLYGEKQASKLQKRELRLSLHSSGVRRNFALGSGGTICLSPVDKNHLSVPLNLYPQFKDKGLAPR